MLHMYSLEQVIAVEPQPSLCEVIRLAASLNGEEIAGRITLYNNAVLEQPEMVAMSKSEVAEGAVAHVDRSAGAGGVQALPIATLAPPTLGRISFLKIDVEGFELLAVPSAYPLFALQLVCVSVCLSLSLCLCLSVSLCLSMCFKYIV